MFESFVESFPVIISIGGLATIFLLKFYICPRRQNYWTKHDVPTVESSFFGHFGKAILFNEPIVERCSQLYKDSAESAPVIGVNIHCKRGLFVCNLDLARRILFEDGSFFGDG